MHKKLEADLVSLAQSILALKKNENIDVLYKKAQAIYEKLAIAKYLQDNLEVKDNNEVVDDEEYIEIENNFNIEIKKEVAQSAVNEENIEDKDINIEDYAAAENKEVFSISENEKEENSVLQTSLEEEFKEAISSTEATKIFENATKENPVIPDVKSSKNKTLNDSLFKNNLQIGLNDRIAFVNQLFDGSQEDFNRVVSQLNTFNNVEDAKNFILQFVKPDYDWSTKLEFEERLFTLIERKFT